MKNLRRLEYFEDVNFSTSPGTTPDRMNLKVTVKERPTGSFGVGAGYSTQDHLVGMVRGQPEQPVRPGAAAVRAGHAGHHRQPLPHQLFGSLPHGPAPGPGDRWL